MRKALALIVALIVVACSWKTRHADFAKKLERGCSTVEECNELWDEANYRVQHCKSQYTCPAYKRDRDKVAQMLADAQELEQKRQAEEKAALQAKVRAEAARLEQEAATAIEALHTFKIGPRLVMASPIPQFEDLPERCAPVSGQPTNPFVCDEGTAWECTVLPYDGCTESVESQTWCCPGTGCAFSRALTRICRDQLHHATLGIACSEGYVPAGCEYAVEYDEQTVQCCKIQG